jgi:hypothetical protein
MPPDVLVNYMPLFQVWDAIIEPKIALEHGYTNKKKGDKSEKAPEIGADFGAPPLPNPSASSPQASASPLGLDEPPVTASEDDLNAFMPATSRGTDAKDDSGPGKSRPKTPPPPLPATATGKAVEDPSTWSQEFDEDTEFVDAADLLDEEPTINSKIGGKETVI